MLHVLHAVTRPRGLILAAQANQRILDSAASRLGVPPERVLSNLAEYGNTSAASIPLALDEAVRARTIAPGNVVRPCSLLLEPPFPLCCRQGPALALLLLSSGEWMVAEAHQEANSHAHALCHRLLSCSRA